MSQPLIKITEPSVRHGCIVQFSAYGFGWGYRAFSVSLARVCKPPLHALEMTSGEVLAAFVSRRSEVLPAIVQLEVFPDAGQQTWLSLSSCARDTSLAGLRTADTEGQAMVRSGDSLDRANRCVVPSFMPDTDSDDEAPDDPNIESALRSRAASVATGTKQSDENRN
ncbi:hypothetical protein [Caballeronia sp. RCC_10]|uniref:hypothetical protein n=1 Tax=Caballeronia sp. RCC_10 TaxID=3239227 RepID=UPI003525D8A1